MKILIILGGIIEKIDIVRSIMNYVIGVLGKIIVEKYLWEGY